MPPRNIDNLEEPPMEECHAYLLLDGSASMKNPESSGDPKNIAVAKMVQGLINEFHDDAAIENTLLTIICWDSNKIDDVRLLEYDVKQKNHYYENFNPTSVKSDDERLKLWDPLEKNQHGGGTPTGRALNFARKMAEDWVKNAQGTVSRRAVIYLLTDGQTYPEHESNGLDQKALITKFNEDNIAKGVVRLLTVGYFQKPEGADTQEDAARKVLRELPLNPAAYKETKNAKDIAQYVIITISIPV